MARPLALALALLAALPIGLGLAYIAALLGTLSFPIVAILGVSIYVLILGLLRPRPPQD